MIMIRRRVFGFWIMKTSQIMFSPIISYFNERLPWGCCCCSVANSCPTICNPINCSMPGFPVHHQPPKFAKTHVHWVSDFIQLSHPLSSPSPPTFSLSQHQGLFQWVSSLHQVAKVLEFSFSNSPSREYSGLISCMIDWFDLLAV